MPPAAAAPPLRDLRDLTRLVNEAEGFDALRRALTARHGGAVDGAWGSSAALALAALAPYAPGTLLVVIAHPGDVDGWLEDLTSFSGARPETFPAWDALPAGKAVADEVARQR